MRNWPYAWALAQGADSPIKGKVGVAPLPKGGADGQAHAARSAAGSSPSRNIRRTPTPPTDLVMYLTSAEEQKRRADRGSLQPDHRRALRGRGGRSRRRPSSASCVGVSAAPSRAPPPSTGDELQQGLERVLQRGASAFSRSSAAARTQALAAPRPRPEADQAQRLAVSMSGAALPDDVAERKPAPGRRASLDALARPGGLALPRADARRPRPRRGLAAGAHDLVQLHRCQSHRPRRLRSSSASRTISPTMTANGSASWPTPTGGAPSGTRSGSRSSRSRSRRCSASSSRSSSTRAFPGRGLVRAVDPDPLGDPDRRLGQDVELDAARPVRRHQRHAAAPRHSSPRRSPGRPIPTRRCGPSSWSTSGRRRRSWRCSSSPRCRCCRSDCLRGGAGRRRPPGARLLPRDAAADPARAARRGHLPRARCAAHLRPHLRADRRTRRDTMSMSVFARQQLVDFQEVGVRLGRGDAALPHHRASSRSPALARRRGQAFDEEARAMTGALPRHRLLAPRRGDRRSSRCSRSTTRSCPRCGPAAICSASPTGRRRSTSRTTPRSSSASPSAATSSTPIDRRRRGRRPLARPRRDGGLRVRPRRFPRPRGSCS